MGVDYIFVSHHIQSECDFKYTILTPHIMRHTHGSELQDLGVDMNIIKDRLGHGSIETTAKYAKPSIETQIRAYERYLANKKGGISNG